MIDIQGISRLRDMLEYAELALTFTASTTEPEFMVDREKQMATTRAIEIIGEACKNVPLSIRELAPEIEWRTISRMRDKLVHHYFGVRTEALWEVVSVDLHPLCANLRLLIAKLEPPTTSS